MSQNSEQQPCRWCAQGDTPRFLDADGTLVSITGNDGILSHAYEEYWWPCLKFGVEMRSVGISPASAAPVVDTDALNDYVTLLERNNGRLREVLKVALDQTGCDGDLCNYRWHEQARVLLGDDEKTVAEHDSIRIFAAEQVAHAAHRYLAESLPDIGAIPSELSELNRALDAWQAFPDARASFDDSQPVLAALASLIEDIHATDHQRRIAHLALIALRSATPAAAPVEQSDEYHEGFDDAARVSRTLNNVVASRSPTLVRAAAEDSISRTAVLTIVKQVRRELGPSYDGQAEGACEDIAEAVRRLRSEVVEEVYISPHPLDLQCNQCGLKQVKSLQCRKCEGQLIARGGREALAQTILDSIDAEIGGHEAVYNDGMRAALEVVKRVCGEEGVEVGEEN